MRRWIVLLAACGAPKSVAMTPPDAAAQPAITSSVTAETANNTSASPLFVDDYHNYNTTSQTGNGNGDLVPRAISRVPLAQHPFVETQTWFCHLASNEDGARLVYDAKCGSHIDVGYNSDDPAQVTAAIDDLARRGVAGAVMDWSGKDSSYDGDPNHYPTDPSTDHARPSGEIATNAIYRWLQTAAQRGDFQIAVMEDEGITNCRKGWNGGCACWPAYSSTCNETSQVISDLMYIQTHWASSPAYMHVDGKPVVLFFAPDYNAAPLTIDWNAVHQFVGDQVWIFENTGGYSHAYSDGGFSWLDTTLYPGSDPSFGLDGLAYYDSWVAAHAKPAQHVFGSAFKGFDDGVTDGWNFGDGSHTRYIEQRCGLTWLATLAQIPSSLEFLQLVTWDDYEEATELQTGIDTCLQSIDLRLDGTTLTWTTRYGTDLTGGATGSEDTIDHFVVWSSPDGEQLVQLASVPTTVHSFDASNFSGRLYVQAVGKPFLANTLSAPIMR